MLLMVGFLSLAFSHQVGLGYGADDFIDAVLALLRFYGD
jgi:hypothetical protein